MRKLWTNLILLSALLLTACSQTTPAPTQPGGGQPASTNTPERTNPTATRAVQQNTGGPIMECRVVSISPTQGPTEASMFPPVSSEDWVQGNTQNPALTVIEYSDYQ